ncbi:MAG: low molecular weight protein-tyrosine-phosphatase [Cyanophyceae cyanobacterium]
MTDEREMNHPANGDQPYRILFVCLGNICRSPAAENIMNHLLAEQGLTDQVVCDSAGTGGWHEGEPPDRRMQAAVKAELDLTMTGSARPLRETDLEEFDLILAMDRDNYWDILKRDPSRSHRDKVKMMCDYCRHHSTQEVPDPYYGGPEGFRTVINLLLDACGGLIETLQEAGTLKG